MLLLVKIVSELRKYLVFLLLCLNLFGGDVVG